MDITKFFTLLAEGDGTGSTGGDWVSLILMLVVMVAAFYFFLIRPNKKQEKEAKNMRDSLMVGDVIVTKGGLIGVIVRIKDDMLLIESGADRSKIQIKNWAVLEVLNKDTEDEK